MREIKRRKRADEDAAFGFAEDLREGRVDHAFRRGGAGLIGIGGIRHQGQHAAPAKFGQLGKIGRLAIHRRVIEFEVAGMDHQSGGRGDAHAHAIGNGVRHAEEFQPERAELDPAAGLDRGQPRLIENLVIAQLHFDQAARQFGGKDRHFRHFLQQVRQAAGVIFVAVRDDDAAQLIALVAQVFPIGDDEVDPQHIVFGEHDAAVDQQDIRAVFKGRHVLADFAAAAQRNDA